MDRRADSGQVVVNGDGTLDEHVVRIRIHLARAG
jgi:hypothetical protein